MSSELAEKAWTLFPAERFGDLATVWDSLNSACQGPPFLHSRFLRHALQHFGSGREVVAVAGPAGNRHAMAVLVREVLGRWRTFQPSQLPLGAWVMRPGVDYQSASRGLFESLPGCPVLLGVTQQDPHMFARPDTESLVFPLDHIETGWLEIGGDFDSYWRERSPHLRQNMRTQHARLRREGVAPVLQSLTDPAGVAAAVADYARLESAGWKAARGTAVTADNAQGRFYRAMMEDFARVGQATAYRLLFGEHVVAVDLCLAAHGTEVLLKTTYDESLPGVSPSTMLKSMAWRRHFETGDLNRCEFFGPFMPWSALWTSKRRTLFHVNCFRWGAVDALRRRVRGWRTATASG